MSTCGMIKKNRTPGRRDISLSRETIIFTAIEILDELGETGLTFLALSKRLATGRGAIYWHVDDKRDLMLAACDAVIARSMERRPGLGEPKQAIRDLALALFDTIDAHPWAGSVLARSPGHAPVLRVLEFLGQRVQAMGVAKEMQWAAVSALLSYSLGVGQQNAANAQFARQHSFDRTQFLTEAANEWVRLDPQAYPFARSMAEHLPTHDDRADFLAGVDFILEGIDRIAVDGRNPT